MQVGGYLYGIVAVAFVQATMAKRAYRRHERHARCLDAERRKMAAKAIK